MCVLFITQFCGFWDGLYLQNLSNYISWVAVATPTDRRKSVRSVV